MVVFLKTSLKVDRSARCETPGGLAGQVRLLRRKAQRRLTARPPGKRASWSGDQQERLLKSLIYLTKSRGQ
ncbi:hypothetical protein ABE41_014800 [Fictibacillus arsenicus]|uniref:Uncharacterized protein n=1 Tax=Fictibacillus arsenicus TaxID=255247 RepID=A0A1B1Z717_9BACL|nr:hypothetical protein ABE41_014800 [Fictibacillus arsenicus]